MLLLPLNFTEQVIEWTRTRWILFSSDWDRVVLSRFWRSLSV